MLKKSTIYQYRWISKNKEKYLKYAKEYKIRNKVKIGIRDKIWRRKNRTKVLEEKTHYRLKHKEHIKIYNRIYRSKNKEKYSAQKKVFYQIKIGKMKRMPCEVCFSKQNIHAHHSDYSKPLDVKWLCGKHHMEFHGRVKYNID